MKKTEMTVSGIMMGLFGIGMLFFDLEDPAITLIFIVVAVAFGIIGYTVAKIRQHKKIKEPDPRKYFNDIKKGN